MSNGLFFEDLSVGQTASLAKTITEADILLYAAVSMDTNPMHLDAEFAGKAQFGERIAHGMLAAGLISAVLGTRLPGPGAIYMRQSLRFAAPVKIGQTVKATVESTTAPIVLSHSHLQSESKPHPRLITVEHARLVVST